MEEKDLKPNVPESCSALGQENEVDLTNDNDKRPGYGSLRLSTSLLMQLGGLVAAAAVAFATANVKVESLQKIHENEATASVEILRRVSELQAKVDYMAEELRYIRARADKMVDQRRKDNDQ